MWWFRRIAWLTKNATIAEGTISTKETTPKTTIFAHSTGRRLGTAVKLARIIPVAYSPVITSTPRTPMASCERLTPASAMSRGWRPARSLGLMWLQCDAVTAAKIAGRPMVRMTATTSDQRVERSEWSFVHSETTTRSCVTRPVKARRGTAGAIAFTPPPPRGTRRRRASAP